MQAWFDGTSPDERGSVVVAVVLLGILAAPVMLFTVLVLAVALIRTLSGRRGGLLQRLLVAGAVGIQAVLQLTRWAVMRRLHRALTDFESQSAR